MQLHKFFRNFFVSNFCLLLPISIFAIGWIPPQVKVEVSGHGENSVVVSDGADELWGSRYGGRKDFDLWHFQLGRGMTLGQLVFQFSDSKDKQCIRRFFLQQWHLLDFEIDGTELEPLEGCPHRYALKSVHITHIKPLSLRIAIGMFCVEMLACLFSLLPLWGEGAPKMLPESFLSALAISLLLNVVLPLQTYWTNQTAFPFSPNELYVDLSIRFVAVLIMGMLALFLGARCFGRWVPWMGLAWAYCIYLSSGLLSIGMPSMTGDWSFYDNRFRAVWDALVWFSVFACAFLSRNTSRLFFVLTAGILIVLSVASLGDVKREETVDSTKLVVSDFCPLDEIADCATYSSRRNVMVFILDSLEREQAHAIVNDAECEKEFYRAFQGFTEYTDNVGAMSSSGFAVANLFTGKYFETGMGIREYFMSVYSRDSVLTEFLDADWDCCLLTSSLGVGYSTHRGSKTSREREMQVSPMSRPMQDAFAWSLADICRFRCLPFILRRLYLNVLTHTLAMRGFIREWNVYPRLAHGAVKDDSPGAFLFMHTEGVHVPIIYNRRGEQLASDFNTNDGCIEMGVCVLRQLAQLFSQYRKVGIYDNSLILVLGDHGRHRSFFAAGDAKALPNNARPCLWIKPVGSTHEFAASGLPTSHSRIFEVLAQSISTDLSERDIQELLQQDERCYQYIPLAGEESEVWNIHRDGRSFRVR